MKKKITKNTTLSEILETSGADKILAKHNLPCLTCPFAKMEMEKLKLGEICASYGINLDKLLKDLNAWGKNEGTWLPFVLKLSLIKQWITQKVAEK